MSEASGVTFEIKAVATSADGAPKHSGGPGEIAVDPTGARALTRDVNGIIDDLPLAWDLATGAAVAGAWLRLHPDGRRGLRREPKGHVALAEFASGKAACTLAGLTSSGAPPVPTPDGAFAVATLGADVAADARPAPFTDVWDLATGRRAHRLDAPLLLGALLPGERLASVDERGVLALWDLRTGKLIAEVPGPRERPRLLRTDAAGHRAIVVTAKGAVAAWDLETKAILATHDAFAQLHGGPPKHVTLLADGRRLVAEGWFLDVLDLETGALDRSWLGRDPNRDRILAVAPLAEGPFVAVLMSRGLYDPNTLEVWDVDRRLRVGLVEAPDTQVLAVARSGRAVVAGDEGVASFQLHARARGELPAQPEVTDAIRLGQAKAIGGSAEANRAPPTKKAPPMKTAAKKKTATKRPK